MADLFPDSVQGVDWYHATEYLACAADALFPSDPDAARRWQRERRDALFLGEMHKLIEPLERAGLTTQADYRRKHQRRMHLRPSVSQAGAPAWVGHQREWHQVLQAPPGWPGHALVPPGGRALLVLRAAVLSGTFD